MTCRAARVLWVLALGLSVTTMLSAQERDTTRRAPTLGQRLEQFRQELFGESDEPAQKPKRRSGNQSPKVAQRMSPHTSSGTTARAGSAFAKSGGQGSSSRIAPPPVGKAGAPRVAENVTPRSSRRTIPTPEAAKSAPSSDTAQTAPEADEAAETADSGAKPENDGNEAGAAAAEEADSAKLPVVVGPAESDDAEVADAAVEKNSPPAKASPRKPVARPKSPSLEERLREAQELAAEPSEPKADERDVSDLLAAQPARSTAPVRKSRPPIAPPSGEEPAAPAKLADAAPSEALLFSGQSPRLSVDAAGPRRVMIGKEAAFTVNVRNVGDVGANNVVITINVPAYVDVASTRPNAGDVKSPSRSDAAEPLEWRISHLEARGRASLTLKLVPRKSSPLDLAMQWSCSPETSQTMVEVEEPKLQLALAGPEEVLYGEAKIYKLTLSNPGNGDAENVVVQLVPIDRSSEGVLRHRVGTLKAGASKAIDVELTARQAGSVTIKATALGDGGLKADVSQPVLVRRAALRIEADGPKAKFAGTTAAYKIHVSNTGNAPAENTQVTVMLPTSAKFISCTTGGQVEAEEGRIRWNLGAMKPGTQRVFDVQCSLRGEGENQTQVVAMAGGDLTDSTTVSTRVEALADLKLEVRDPQGPLPIGEDAVFDVVVRNRGTKAAENVELVVFFSEGLEATAAEGGAHEIEAGQVVFQPVATIGPQSETVFRIHATAEKVGNHVFRAEVVCPSLRTKLAAEETTHFYGEDALVAQRPTHDEPAAKGKPAASVKRRLR